MLNNKPVTKEDIKELGSIFMIWMRKCIAIWALLWDGCSTGTGSAVSMN